MQYLHVLAVLKRKFGTAQQYLQVSEEPEPKLERKMQYVRNLLLSFETPSTAGRIHIMITACDAMPVLNSNCYCFTVN